MQEKHQSKRSVVRLFGQDLDASGNVVGAPVEVRFAHCFIHTKRTKSAAGDPVEKPHYYTVVLVPKISNDPAQCPNYQKLAAMCMEACTQAWGSFPQGGKWPIQDGDVPYQQKPKPGATPLTPEQIAERNKWRVGYWQIEVTNYNDAHPKVCVFQNGSAIELPAQNVGGQTLYKSGDYGYVSMNAYTFHNKTFGCNFGFEGVLFTRPGDMIGSSGPRSAQQMFGSVATVTAAAPTPSLPSTPPLPTSGPAVGAPAAPLAPVPPVAPAPAAMVPQQMAAVPSPSSVPHVGGYQANPAAATAQLAQQYTSPAPPAPPAMPALPPFPGQR